MSVAFSDSDLEADPELAVFRDGEVLVVACSGAWQTRSLDRIDRSMGRLKLAGQAAGARSARIDLAAVTRLDTAGVQFVLRLESALATAAIPHEIVGATDEQTRLIAAVRAEACVAAPEPKQRPSLVEMLETCGRAAYQVAGDAKLLVNFLGNTWVCLVMALLRPWRIRWRAVIRHMETTGLNALPIVGLISFLIGLVLAFQGAAQLEQFGAQIFTVNIVGIGVLREMAILLTAIIVAGRSGSAFTAQLGSMQVNEEIDALRTLGLDPMEVLVLPRVLGLVFAMPFLAFYADIMGLLGGAVMIDLVLGISLSEFITQLRHSVSLGDLFVGLVKGPPFAFLIAMVGCFEGFRVSRNAESVGHATTRAVVEGIFLVIVLDAVLSIFFQVIGV